MTTTAPVSGSADVREATNVAFLLFSLPTSLTSHDHSRLRREQDASMEAAKAACSRRTRSDVAQDAMRRMPSQDAMRRGASARRGGLVHLRKEVRFSKGCDDCTPLNTHYE